MIDGIKTYYLGFGLLLILFISFLYWRNNANLTNQNLSYYFFYFLGFPILIYFLIIFNFDIYQISNFPIDPGMGNDWSTIFSIARFIAIYDDHSLARYCLSNIYLNYGDDYIKYIQFKNIRDNFCLSEAGVYHHNPLYRYICALFFSFFGHGNFSIKILDVWSIILINF